MGGGGSGLGSSGEAKTLVAGCCSAEDKQLLGRWKGLDGFEMNFEGRNGLYVRIKCGR